MTTVHEREETQPSVTDMRDTGLLGPVYVGTAARRETSDAAFVAAMLDAEAALARAEATVGMVPPSAADTITRLARAEALDLDELAARCRETANPVVGLVAAFTAHVAETDPDAAECVHRGSTSQDVLDTAVMAICRRVLTGIVADLDAAAGALADLAARHRDTPMAGRTLAQHAVPTTFGLKAAGWLVMVDDARRRLAALAARLPAQLGGAAGTQAAYAEQAVLTGAPGDPGEVCERLEAEFAHEAGLARPVLPWHVLRAPMVDVAQELAGLAGSLGKIAADVVVLSRTEVGELAEPSAPGRGASSAMPQKANPVFSAVLRATATQAPGLASTLVLCAVAEDERPAGAWHAEWLPLRECLRCVGGAASTAREMIEGLEVFPDRMRENLDRTGALVVTERLSAVLGHRLGKVEAKTLLTDIARQAGRDPAAAADLVRSHPQVAGTPLADDLDGLLDPTHYLGTAGRLVDRALAHYSPHPE